MKESTALRATIANSRSAMIGSTARSRPTMPPTNALMATSSQNCRQFCLRPRTGSRSARLGGEIDCAYMGGIRRRRGNVAEHRRDERVALLRAERAIESPLETNRRRWLTAQAAAADRSGNRPGPHLDVIGEQAERRRRLVERRRALGRVAGKLS